MKTTRQQRSGALTAAVVSLMLACSGTSFSQNLGDAARQERERKQNLAHHAAHVYTDDDLKKPEILVPEDRERVLAARKKLNEPVDQSVDADAAAPGDPKAAVAAAPPAPVVVANIGAIARAHAAGTLPRVPVVTAHDRSSKPLPKFSAVPATPPRGAFLSPEIVEKRKRTPAATAQVAPPAPVRENAVAAKAVTSKQASAAVPVEPVIKESAIAKANVEQKRQVAAVAAATPVVENSAVAKVQTSKHVSTAVAVAPVATRPVEAKLEHQKQVPVAPANPVAQNSVVAKVQTSKPVSTAVIVAPAAASPVVAKAEHKKQIEAVAPVVPVAVNATVAKVQPAKHAPTLAPASPTAQNAVVAKVEDPKTAPAVEPVIPVAEHHSVAKVQTSTHAAPVAQVAPVTPVAQVAPVKPNAPIATVGHNTPSPAIAAVRPVAPVKPVAEISNAASVQPSAHVPAAVPGNSVRANAVIANAVVAKTERRQPVPAPAHIAPVRPAAEVNVAAKVVRSEHVAAANPATPPVAEHPIVPVAEKTAVVTTVAAQPEAGLETGDRVQVQKGDSLWKLAEEHLGNGARWPELARINPEIEDPNLVRIGEWVRVPDEKREAAEHKVVVQPGDTLSKVAQDEFGNARAFTCIAEANPALQGVDRIYPGETLVLPPTCNVTR